MTVPFATAVIVYDVVAAAVFALDFIAISRRNEAVIPKAPPLLMLVVLAAMTSAVASNRVEFTLVGVTVLGAAVFGYANFLAFVKRGVTFSIISNHTRRPTDRLPDFEFIAIEDRLDEMRRHGWAAEIDGRWALTESGQRVARLRAMLMRVLKIEAVG